jgi:hypothetical protein
MISLDRLKDIRRLEFLLFGGLPQEEGERIQYENPSPQNSGEKKEITGYAEFDLRTGEITCYSIK